jgi:hypothetical protein
MRVLDGRLTASWEAEMAKEVSIMLMNIAVNPTSVRSDFLRYLGAFEHLHWLFSQSRPRAFSHAMEVMGTTTVDQWRALPPLKLVPAISNSV